MAAVAAAEPQGSGVRQVVPQPQMPPNGDDRHNVWLRMSVSLDLQTLATTGENRRMLFELLSMLCLRNRCQDVLDTVGMAGALQTNDTVYIRGHTGLYLGAKTSSEIICNKADRHSAAALVIESKAPALRPGCRISFCLADQAGRMGVDANGEAKMLPKGGSKDAEQFVIQAFMGDWPMILSGMPVTLRSAGNGKHLDVEGEIVRARSSDRGTLQRIVLEKIPSESEIPSPCSDRDLSVQDQAWLFRRGVQLALIDKQAFAAFVSKHKGVDKDLLLTYTCLWEAEWRATRPSFADGAGDESGGSPGPGGRTKSVGARGEASKRSTSRPRARTMDTIFSMFGGVNADDKANGDMFTDALRSFFANALRMSQLEADCVQRVIEAFAAALVKDGPFIEAFSASMLPVKERKTYSTPEEVLFGLAYTTMMLNTDAHNQQVAQKMWDNKKFVSAAKDCGVTNGLMMQIFKNVQKEQL